MRLKRGLLAGIALCCMPLMTACSAKDTIGILVGNNSEDTKKEEVTVDLNAANIDDSVEKPQITSEMGDPVTYDLHATADALTVEATVSEGTLSYQWYRNNVDSNGGGTAIDGATAGYLYDPDCCHITDYKKQHIGKSSAASQNIHQHFRHPSLKPRFRQKSQVIDQAGDCNCKKNFPFYQKIRTDSFRTKLLILSLLLQFLVFHPRHSPLLPKSV